MLFLIFVAVLSPPLSFFCAQNGWRWPFKIEGIMMIPFVIYTFLVPRFLRGRKTIHVDVDAPVVEQDEKPILDSEEAYEANK